MNRRGGFSLAVLVAVIGLAGLVAACGGSASAATAAANQAFLASVHNAVPDIGSYRSDVQLMRLGHTACDGFRSGASYQGLADRLVLIEGPHPLPTEDLGAVITAAAQAYCPAYRSEVS